MNIKALWKRHSRQIWVWWVALVVATWFSWPSDGSDSLLTPVLFAISAASLGLLVFIEIVLTPKEPYELTARRPKRRIGWQPTKHDQPWDSGEYVLPRLVLSDNGHAPEEGRTTFCPLCETMYIQPGFCGNLDCEGFSRQRLLNHYPPKDPSWKN